MGFFSETFLASSGTFLAINRALPPHFHSFFSHSHLQLTTKKPLPSKLINRTHSNVVWKKIPIIHALNVLSQQILSKIIWPMSISTVLSIRHQCLRIGPRFYANHAFLYFIRDNHSSTVAFAGCMKRPQRNWTVFENHCNVNKVREFLHFSERNDRLLIIHQTTRIQCLIRYFAHIQKHLANCSRFRLGSESNAICSGRTWV